MSIVERCFQRETSQNDTSVQVILNGKYFFSLGANVIHHMGSSVMDSPFKGAEIAIFDHDDVSQI